MTPPWRSAVTAWRGRWRLDERVSPGVRLRHVPRPLASIRARLSLWYGAILALVLLLCSGAIFVTEQQSLLAQADGQLTPRLQQWAASYDERSGRLAAPRDPDIAQGAEVVLLVTPGGRVLQTLAAGRLAAVKVPWDQAVRTLQAVAAGGPTTVVELGLQLETPVSASKDGGAPVTTTQARTALFRLTGRPLMVRGRVAALLVVGIRSDVPRQMATLARTLATIVPLTLLLCAGGGYWLATRAMGPIRTITRTAREIGATDLRKRLNLGGEDEVGQLATTIDHMLERLDAAFARQRQFTADASHELRTPLAIVDLEATRALARPRTPAAYRQAIALMQQEAAHMARLIDDLLTLARTDSGDIGPRRAEVEVGEVVLDVVDRLAPLARRSAMALTIAALPGASIWGDGEALTRMLTNVVENALKYGAGHGTQVHLSGGPRRRDAVAGMWLQVADDGPGIAAEHLPYVCDRFYRIDPARTHSAVLREEVASAGTYPTGHGLGLAISQQIVSDHGGTLHLHSDGAHGVVVDIWLPTGERQED